MKKENESINIEKHIINTFRIDSITNNPFQIILKGNIVVPDSDDAWNFIIQFDEKGKFIIFPDEEDENEDDEYIHNEF